MSLDRFVGMADLATRALVERSVPFWPRPWLERLQRRRLQAILRHAYQTVPFYRRALDERGLRPRDFRSADDLQRLPLIDGLFVQRNLDQFVSTQFGEGSARQEYHSSGSSTGIRRTSYWDDRSVLRELAYAERDRAVVCRLVGKTWGQKQLFLLPSRSITLDQRAYWDRRIRPPRWLAYREQFAAEHPFEAAVERINEMRPDIVYSYGCYADHFARYVVSKGLRVAAPRIWMYGGDMLSAAGRELMEREIGASVYTTYQSNEGGRLGFQCERREGFHLNADLCPLRIVDAEGRTRGADATGDVVISNLYNRAMVLLNYRIGDRGRLDSAPCGCGRTLPLLRELEGRSTDVLRTAGGRELSAFMLEASCRNELRATLQVQIARRGERRLTWRVVLAQEVERDAFTRALAERTRAVLGGLVDVEVAFVDSIPVTPLGKLLRVVDAPPERLESMEAAHR